MDSTYFVVCTAYSAISIPVYLRIICVLMRRPEFAKLPFYRLLCVNGILDVSNVLCTMLFYEFPMFGPTKDWYPRGSSRLVSLAIVTHFASIYQLFFLHVAISFNRLTAILWPFHHRVLWKKWWPAIPIGGALASMALTFHRMFAVSYFAPIDLGKCGFTPSVQTYDFYQVNQNMVTAVLGLLCLLTCLACNGSTLWLILRQNGQMRSQQQQQHSAHQRNAFRSEVRMYIISFWMCIFMVVFIGRQLLVYARGEGLLASLVPWATSGQVACFVFSQIPWTEAVFSLGQPWVLLLANKQVRQAALPTASWLKCLARKMPGMATAKSSTLQPQQKQQQQPGKPGSRLQRGRSVFVVSSSSTTTTMAAANQQTMPLSARAGGGGGVAS